MAKIDWHDANKNPVGSSTETENPITDKVLNPHNIQNLKDARALDPEIHSVISPSNFARVMLCPGSVIESIKAGPQESSEAAQHGTMLHERTEWAIREMMDVKSDHSPGTWDKDLEPEDTQHVLTCVDEFERILGECEAEDSVWRLEVKGSLAQWGLPWIFGTKDLKVIDLRPHPYIYLRDWKFGAGVQVFTFLGDSTTTPLSQIVNKQLLGYAAMCIGPETYKKHDLIEFDLGITQPPFDYNENIVVRTEDVMEFMNNFKAVLHELRSPVVQYNPGKMQCQFCPGAMTCGARWEYQQDLAKTIHSAYTSIQQKTITPAMLAKAVNAAKEHKKWIGEVEKYTLNQALDGTVIPDMKVVRGRKSREWKSEKEALLWLENRHKGDEIHKHDIVSPAQAEKLNRKYKKDESFQALINVKPGKPQLVHISDKREEYVPEKSLEDDFKEYEVNDPE